MIAKSRNTTQSVEQLQTQLGRLTTALHRTVTWLTYDSARYPELDCVKRSTDIDAASDLLEGSEETAKLTGKA